jgi:hypothetical protein
VATFLPTNWSTIKTADFTPYCPTNLSSQLFSFNATKQSPYYPAQFYAHKATICQTKLPTFINAYYISFLTALFEPFLSANLLPFWSANCTAFLCPNFMPDFPT